MARNYGLNQDRVEKDIYDAGFDIGFWTGASLASICWIAFVLASLYAIGAIF